MPVIVNKIVSKQSRQKKIDNETICYDNGKIKDKC